VTEAHVISFRRHLATRSSPRTGKPLEVSTQALYLSVVRGFFRYLQQERVILNDPARGVPLPRCARLPRAVSESQARRLVHAPDARVSHLPRTGPGDTWRLHRRLGVGWRDLAAQGKRPSAWREPALRVSARWVVRRVRDDGPPVPAPAVLGVHAVAMAARWTGRVTGPPRRLR